MARQQVGMGLGDGGHDAVHLRLEVLLDEAEDGHVVQRVVRLATGGAVSVGGAEHHIALVVALAEALAQALDYRLVDRLEQRAGIHVDEHHRAFAARLGNDVGARVLAVVNAAAFLRGVGIAHHADLGGGTGDIVLADANQVVVAVGLDGQGQNAAQKREQQCGDSPCFHVSAPRAGGSCKNCNRWLELSRWVSRSARFATAMLRPAARPHARTPKVEKRQVPSPVNERVRKMQAPLPQAGEGRNGYCVPLRRRLAGVK